MPASCIRRRSARRSISVGTLDKKQFPNTQIVVKGNLVAVVDPLEYNAIEAASLLARTTKWTDWAGLPGSGNLFAALRKADWTTTPRQHAASTSGSADAAFASAATKLSATYQYPFEKHAPIGPTCAVADVPRRTGWSTCTSTARTRTAMRWELAMMLNTSIDKVVVRSYDGSGHYGRSNGGSTGAEDEAVIISQVVGKPVRLQWMRWDDMQWSTQHPPAFSDVQAGLDSSGKLVSFKANHYMPAMQDDRMVGALLAGLPTIDGAGGRALSGHVRLDRRTASPTRGSTTRCRTRSRRGLGTFADRAPTRRSRTSTRRSACATTACAHPAQRQQNFAQESMMNELAAAAKIDPIQFRHQQHDRRAADRGA